MLRQETKNLMDEMRLIQDLGGGYEFAILIMIAERLERIELAIREAGKARSAERGERLTKPRRPRR